MKRPSRWLIAVSFAVGMLSIPLILAQAQKGEREKEGGEIEKQVDMDEVSAQAKKTILKVAGKHKIKEIEEVTKGKRKFYEAEWEVDCEAVEIEIKVAPDGKILDVEVEEADHDEGEDEEGEEEENEEEAEEQERTMTLDMAPAPVKRTIRAQIGKRKIKEIEEVTQGDRKFYEAEWVVKGEDLEIEIRVNRRGRLLGIEVEADDAAAAAADDDDDDDDDD